MKHRSVKTDYISAFAPRKQCSSSIHQSKCLLLSEVFKYRLYIKILQAYKAVWFYECQYISDKGESKTDEENLAAFDFKITAWVIVLSALSILFTISTHSSQIPPDLSCSSQSPYILLFTCPAYLLQKRFIILKHIIFVFTDNIIYK